MFEEAQLYSPVTQAEDGSVTVHLSDDHPGKTDPVYQERRNEIAAAALQWRRGEPIPQISYTEEEQEVWRTVQRELAPKHAKYACTAFLEAKAALDLPMDRIPQLNEVTDRLGP
jgi:phenylalanine-4-hydroxylase